MSPWLCVCTIEVSWGRLQTFLKIVLLCSAEERKQVKNFFFHFWQNFPLIFFKRREHKTWKTGHYWNRILVHSLWIIIILYIIWPDHCSAPRKALISCSSCCFVSHEAWLIVLSYIKAIYCCYFLICVLIVCKISELMPLPRAAVHACRYLTGSSIQSSFHVVLC